MSLLEDVHRELFSEYQHSVEGACIQPRILLRWYDMLERYMNPPDPPLTREQVSLRNAGVLRRAAEDWKRFHGR